MTRVLLHGIDLSAALVARSNQAAADAGLSDVVRFEAADLNDHAQSARYECVVANQVLPHITDLERVFDTIHSILTGDPVAGHSPPPDRAFQLSAVLRL